FVLTYVKCPLDVCIKRDNKGLYKKAIAGEIKNFTGISHPFEEPINPEIIIETDKESSKECKKKIIKKLEDLGYLLK
ncbi:MAG: adenylyl-sulfate kinase, partial [Candidatus Helarchaeota archaeon]|nr:adenylyl-sulfate kinase [Candidatus Helarchaeota archaeon]